MILDLREGKLGKSSSDAYSKPGEKRDSFTSIISQNCPPPTPSPSSLPRASTERGTRSKTIHSLLRTHGQTESALRNRAGGPELRVYFIEMA